MKLQKKSARLFFPASSTGELARTTHLCIAAHQDDIELMAAGAILECFGKKDKSFTGVVVTDGSGSPRTGVYENCTDEEMKAIRLKEQEIAAEIGRYNAQFQLGYTSSEVKSKKEKGLVEELAEIIMVTKPEVLLIHNFADKHNTHCALAIRTLEALRKIPGKKRPPAVYSMEVWRSLDWLCDNQKVLFDTSSDESLQLALVGVFHSQIAAGKRYDLAGVGRKRANATFLDNHSVDNYTSVEYGLDVTALVNEESLTPTVFINKYIDKFKEDVNYRISKFI